MTLIVGLLHGAMFLSNLNLVLFRFGVTDFFEFHVCYPIVVNH